MTSVLIITSGKRRRETILKFIQHVGISSHFQSTAVSGAGSSPVLATCEISQVLLVDVPD